MNRLLLYVHFNKYGQISEHVKYQLEKLRPLFSKVVLISNSPLSIDNQTFLTEHGLMNDFIQRKNEGFDFAAWSDGMSAIGFDQLTQYDSVTLMNDTCFGPLWDLEPIYQNFERRSSVDFWGMTNHRATSDFKEHLQSYFLSFKQSVVQSSVFLEFWQGIESHTEVQTVIDLFETRLTTLLVDAGFNYDAVFDTREAKMEFMAFPDFSFYNPTEIINRRVPFLKVKAIEGNQNTAAFILEELSKISDYPVSLIKYHMAMMFSPTAKYLMKDKYELLPTEKEVVTDKKIAIHLHVFYPDLLGDFLAVFQTYSFAYDLFITTDSNTKVAEISAILETFGQSASIDVTGNRGRDVLPMLKLKDKLSGYDYIGHFHTKKSKEADFWAGESWRNELIAMLLKPAGSIIERLEEDDHLGLVIADIPTYFRYVQLDPYYENSLSDLMMTLWEQMGLKKSIDFSTSSNYVMSYGTYVWFKYDALKPLFDLDLTDGDVPREPLPQRSVLHAIERLVVYVAWAQGYDFLISQNKELLPPFIEVAALNTVEKTAVTPFSTVDFTYFGGLKGALKYFVFANKTVLTYLVKRLVKGRY